MKELIQEDVLTAVCLSEGWVNFIRFHCKDGHIDKWFGDCVNNPNWPSENMMRLNSSSEFYRFNNGKWISRYEFKNEFSNFMIKERHLFTSDEIFAYYSI